VVIDGEHAQTIEVTRLASLGGGGGIRFQAPAGDHAVVVGVQS